MTGTEGAYVRISPELDATSNAVLGIIVLMHNDLDLLKSVSKNLELGLGQYLNFAGMGRIAIVRIAP